MFRRAELIAALSNLVVVTAGDNDNEWLPFPGVDALLFSPRIDVEGHTIYMVPNLSNAETGTVTIQAIEADTAEELLSSPTVLAEYTVELGEEEANLYTRWNRRATKRWAGFRAKVVFSAADTDTCTMISGLALLGSDQHEGSIPDALQPIDLPLPR